MRPVFRILSMVIFAACESSDIADEFPETLLAPNSTASMSAAEIDYYAQQTARQSGLALSCVGPKMTGLGQDGDFTRYVENQIKCGGSDNPRRIGISYIQADAEGQCGNMKWCQGFGWGPPEAMCPVFATCWDGTVPDPRNPCELTCPEIPRLN